MTTVQIQDAFFVATLKALGLDPDDADNQARVRISYPLSDTGSTNWRRDEDVTFLRISPASDDYTLKYDADYIQYDGGAPREHVVYHRAWQIDWVCYGPHAFEDADAIRIGIMRDAIRAYLRQYQLAIMPAIGEPQYVPEQDESGEWWQRADLTARLYELGRRTYPAETIEQPPAITIM